MINKHIVTCVSCGAEIKPAIIGCVNGVSVSINIIFDRPCRCGGREFVSVSRIRTECAAKQQRYQLQRRQWRAQHPPIAYNA